MASKNVIIIFLNFIFLQSVFAFELKDATLRDETIAASEVSVEYFTRPDGLYEYVYKIINPLENKGMIDDFLIDLSCSKIFESVTLPYANEQQGYEGDHSRNPLEHTPVAVHADPGSSGIYGITENNAALWGLVVSVGNEVIGLRLISPASPGIRMYQLMPKVDYDDEVWQLPEDINLVPKAHDFAITGLIAAPGCPGVTEPPSETNLFAGTGFRVEPENINALLSYRTPQKDRFHVDAGTKEITLHIFYSKDIDEKTFKVEPAWMKRFFNPVAGTDEQVILPLRKARNKIKLSVHIIKATGTTRKDNESHHSYKDTDVFEIRIDGTKK